MTRPVVIVMVKQVVAGRAKTRLGREVGMTRAAWWQRHQTARLLRRLRDPRWQIVLAVTPDTAIMTGTWPADLRRVPQGRGDLGRRMARAIANSGPGKALLIGSDVPKISRDQIAHALSCLGPARCVLGPSEDGGYWCVGYHNAVEASPAHFARVRWSGPHALEDTRARLPAPVALAHTLRDVDHAHDLAPGDLA